MIIGALLLHFVLAPRQSTIEFDSKAAAIGQVLEKLSSETGTKLRAAPRIAQEIVFVHAKQVDLTILKARLAGALSATWTKDGEYEVLTRTAALDNEIWKSHVAYRRKLVDEALKDVRKKLETPFDAKTLAVGLANLPSEEEVRDDPAAGRRRYETERGLFDKGPLTRLLNKLLLACNPNDLAAVGPYERRIFKLNPTTMQRGFESAKFNAAMASYAAEQEAWVEEAAKTNFKPEQNGRMVSDPRSQLDFGKTLPNLALEIKRGESTALLHVNLTCEREYGNAVVTQVSLADPARKFLDSHMTPAATKIGDPLVELSEDSKEFQERMKEAFTGRQPNGISPKMIQMMLGMVARDPLSWVVSDGLSAYARSKNENLVAAVPDAALSMTAFISRENSLTVGLFMSGLIGAGTVQLNEKDGWATITPTDRYEANIDFTPRASAVALIKAVLASGRLDIRDYAKYAYDSHRLNRGGFGYWFLAMYDRSVLGTSDRTDWKSLQLYGSFSPEQQLELTKGAQFPYAGMGLEQRRIVDRIVYANRLGSGQLSAGGVTTSTTRSDVEPTEAFAAGVPDTCVTSALVRKDPVIVAYGKGSDGKTRPSRHIDPYTLATVETELLGNPERMAQYGVANLAGYALGTNMVLTLRVEVAPKIWAQANVTVPEYDMNANPVPWDKLPEPYPKNIAAAIAQLKANKAKEPGKAIPPSK
jgi:hypothetical protein